MTELFIALGMLGAFLLVVGIAMPKTMPRKLNLNSSKAAQAYYRPRSVGDNKLLSGVANAGVRRALKRNGANAAYLRQLMQADWYWAPGEPVMPNSKAPFWNVETLWGEKIFGVLVYGGLTAAIILLLGIVAALATRSAVMPFILAATVIGGVVAFYGFATPDNRLAAAAQRRQRELTLEMGYRIPELRGDVMAGNTIQRAIRNLAARPGGPFVEELRRAVAVLDITKDDVLAMDQMILRNDGNELLAEFANNLKMVSRQGGQIGPVLNVLTDLAQQRLRLSIQGQARRNLQEMTRPIGLSSLIVTTLLIIVPAIVGVVGSLMIR